MANFYRLLCPNCDSPLTSQMMIGNAIDCPRCKHHMLVSSPFAEDLRKRGRFPFGKWGLALAVASGVMAALAYAGISGDLGSNLAMGSLLLVVAAFAFSVLGMTRSQPDSWAKIGVAAGIFVAVAILMLSTVTYNGRVSRPNLSKVKREMSLDEVAEILGSGTNLSSSENTFNPVYKWESHTMWATRSITITFYDGKVSKIEHKGLAQ